MALQGAEELDELRAGMVGIEPAGIGEQPDASFVDGSLLEAADRARIPECEPVGAEAEDREGSGLEGQDLADELSSSAL